MRTGTNGVGRGVCGKQPKHRLHHTEAIMEVRTSATRQDYRGWRKERGTEGGTPWHHALPPANRTSQPGPRGGGGWRQGLHWNLRLQLPHQRVNGGPVCQRARPHLLSRSHCGHHNVLPSHTARHSGGGEGAAYTGAATAPSPTTGRVGRPQRAPVPHKANSKRIQRRVDERHSLSLLPIHAHRRKVVIRTRGAGRGNGGITWPRPSPCPCPCGWPRGCPTTMPTTSISRGTNRAAGSPRSARGGSTPSKTPQQRRP
jgi:hypothetical protein